jgi:hypothetical protein
MVYVLWSSHHWNAYIGGHDIRQKKGHVTIHQHGPNMGIEFLSIPIVDHGTYDIIFRIMW